MRINRNNYPMLDLLKWHERLLASPLAKKMAAWDEKGARRAMGAIDHHWPRLVYLFGKRIDIASDQFMKAAFMNGEKIGSKENIEMLYDNGPLSGTLIMGKYVTFYSFDVHEDWNESVLICFYENVLAVAVMNSAKAFYFDPRKEGVGLAEYQELFREIQIGPILFNLFKKYAEVETVEAQMGKKVEIPETSENLLVEFDMPMTYTDCSWFREIIRKEGFLVRGHFRLQPYKKDGEWTKKLIYIEPFQKHGYTRKAKIDRQQDII